METAIWEWIKTQGPFAGLLGAILLLGAKQIWVWGWLYREQKRQAERWEMIALRALGVAESTVDVLKKP